MGNSSKSRQLVEDLSQLPDGWFRVILNPEF